ncbi:GSCOCG00003163001-RA-CDS [Cotesia congregata]|uniref:NADH dehydrogenase [ubiquinone] 1 alpha subcomplex subunit 7 n=1 Tax=Cotesia congregata TaxID=51543 RepID=A0A8J2HP83_COTCN|nr:GSCOCG00003163001-RA-CDS [Cotesia congregata]CAG5103309.1 Similar to NDUFA7: NADH dehydrogenase [ubiquinone] 1 alpha subcomplex subunit 7 (Bos taurus) [Cotesia congregata]
MSGKIPHRDVGPTVQLIRRLIRGRKFVPHLRFADELASRTQPPPSIPGGPFHKTSKVYYYTRDARRLVTPPEVLATAKMLTAGGSDVAKREPVKPVTPNKVYDPPFEDPPKITYLGLNDNIVEIK